MVIESELKFQVPAAYRIAAMRVLATPSAVVRLLPAVGYLDTPDRQLAAAGLALRLRREARRWTTLCAT
jgi:triphosphatase